MDAEIDAPAVERLHELISREAVTFGPEPSDDLDDELFGKPVKAALEEWVLVMTWTDLETGDSHLTRTWSRGLPFHHRTGLLHEALHW
jgi:hypothetical protein